MKLFKLKNQEGKENLQDCVDTDAVTPAESDGTQMIAELRNSVERAVSELVAVTVV